MRCLRKFLRNILTLYLGDLCRLGDGKSRISEMMSGLYKKVAGRFEETPRNQF